MYTLHKLQLIVMYIMYEGPLQNTQHLYLYDSVTRLYGIRIQWDETKMNKFLISLSHPCMYGRGNIRDLEEVVELRTRPLLA